uniref:Neurofilament heavy polypeptide n=1 Tax=Rhipicephalus zambeziensis TaxID=60191 RepID=A0A224YM75_9ACAR
MEKPEFHLSIPPASPVGEKHLSESSVHVEVDATLESEYRHEALGSGQAEQLAASETPAVGSYAQSASSSMHPDIEKLEPVSGSAAIPEIKMSEALAEEKKESCDLDKELEPLLKLSSQCSKESQNKTVPGAIQDMAEVPAPPGGTGQPTVAEVPTSPGEPVLENAVEQPAHVTGEVAQDISEQASSSAGTVSQDVIEQAEPINEAGSEVAEQLPSFAQAAPQNVAEQDAALAEVAESSDTAAQNGSAATSEPELRRSSRPRKPSVRMRSPGGETVERSSEPAVLKRKSALHKIPDNLQAVVPASAEPLTPTKSLPSKMERMEFGNSSSHHSKANRKTSDKEKTCITHYRQQVAPLRNISDSRLSQYACQKCSFRTNRMDNLVRHNKQDCAYVKDFFSWDANTFTEATQMPKKRSLSPEIACVSDGTEKASKPSSRRKRPMTKFERSPRASEKKKPATSPGYKQMIEMHEESSEDDNDASASDATAQEKIEFAEDDVVWVEWKRLHWPALVLKVYPKTRKARVFLIHSITAKETALVNIKKMFNFNNAERNKQFLNEGRVGHNSGALVKAAQKAEEFLRKRCLGSSVDAKRFFWNEDGDACTTDSDDFDLDPFCPEADDDDGLDSVVSRIKEKRKQCNEKLVQCIREGKVNDHLLGVLNGTVPSERNKLFYSTSRSEHLQLKDWSWFGPIEDVSQQEEIYEFCFELLKANSDLGPTFDIASYVIEVWCPEAVMKALSLTRGINMDKAEEVLLRAVIHTRAEFEANRQDVCSTPLDPEAERERSERAHTELRDSGIADDIIAALL